jgi:hypothetical protein
MKKIIFLLFISISLFSCSKSNPIENKKDIDKMLNLWHQAAAESNFENYFNLMTEDAVFIGTDATENWNRKDFENFSKPYFDKGKAWTFHPIQRNIYLDNNSKFGWFDELLDSSFKICRGSGIVENVNGKWKVKHYVLSMTIPNHKSNQVVAIKDSLESILIMELKQTKK